MTTPLKQIITKGKRLQHMQAVFHYSEFLEENNIKSLYNTGYFLPQYFFKLVKESW